ncbi:hypothetical protein [Endozoicomonas atrinae]|uniref:hypothetical protein n=1 Tax=Endozoicomonas atrinae TaxID=1333660 RepID=UPI000825E08C|nr:hypothetical protein [Endozoicomonas atrinae]
MELNLNVWKRGSQRAVHKPLLLLYVLSQYQKGHERFFTYAEIDKPLKELLVEFGPSNAQNTSVPFWRLQNDSFWELKNYEQVVPNSSGDAKKSELLEYNVAGGFVESVYNALVQDRAQVAHVVCTLLDEFFPEARHGAIINKLDVTE